MLNHLSWKVWILNWIILVISTHFNKNIDHWWYIRCSHYMHDFTLVQSTDIHQGVSMIIYIYIYIYITYADRTAFLQRKYAGTLYFSNITSVSFSLFALVFHYNPWVIDEKLWRYLLTEASENSTGCNSDSDLMCLSYKWSIIFSNKSHSSTIHTSNAVWH